MNDGFRLRGGLGALSSTGIVTIKFLGDLLSQIQGLDKKPGAGIDRLFAQYPIIDGRCRRTLLSYLIIGTAIGLGWVDPQGCAVTCIKSGPGAPIGAISQRLLRLAYTTVYTVCHRQTK